MEFRILGPLEVRSGEGDLELGGPKPRALLAQLLVHANETVSAERLAMGLWGEDAGAGAVKTLQVSVSRLRKALGAGNGLQTVPGGYRLRVGPGELDAERFAELAAEGRERLAAGDAERAATVLREALGLWRGPALADVAAAPFAASEIARLEEQRLGALEARVEADLAAGRHAEVVGELQHLTAEHPARERVHSLLMLALYRSGRQAAALDAYRTAHAYLTEQLGLEPGSELRSLQAEILNQSPALEAPPAPVSVTGLPARAGLLGREPDVEAVIDLLRREGAQLVALTGVGGVGKTSLAVEVAHRMAAELSGRAVFVDLAPVAEPAGVADAALRALGGTVEPGDTAATTLCRLLALRPRLVLLDNFEHVIDAAALLPGLLAAAPGLKLLVTSREALDLRAEQRYALEPLALPASCDPADVAAAPASALFIARASARDPGLRLTEDTAEAIAVVCRRLDALPLAIELAAARAGVLSAQEIAGRLDSVLALGVGPRDAPARQRTLRAALDWSDRLLDDEERAAFARLSVFAGGCDADAAEEVAGAPVELVQRLVAKSMLVRRAGPGGATRLVMLEPVHEYAAERLAERSDAAEVERRHAHYYLRLAEAARPGLMGGEQVAWGLRIDAEAANLRRALQWGRTAGDAELMLRIMAAVDEWWFARGLWSEGRAWLRWALERGDERVPPEIRAAGWQALGYLLWPEEDFDAVLAAADRAWALASAAGDGEEMAWCQILRSHTFGAMGDVAAARAAATEAARLAEDVDDQARGAALYALATCDQELAEARRIAERAAVLFERSGDLRGLARLWEEVGYIALAAGAVDVARDMLDRADGLGRRLGDAAEGVTRLVHLGVVAVEAGDDEVARRRLSDALTLYRERGIRAGLSEALLAVAVLAARDGDPSRAGRLVGAAAARTRSSPDALQRRLEATASTAAVAHCAPEAWEHAVAAGRRLTWEESIELGLHSVYHASRRVPPTHTCLPLSPGISISDPPRSHPLGLGEARVRQRDGPHHAAGDSAE